MTPSSLINGRPGNSLDVRDRGLLYGDGLFDTLAVRDGRPQFWERHMGRLLEGCQRLRLAPADPSLLRAEADALCAGAVRGILKIVLTRGPGARGYRFDAGAPGTRILTLSAAADYPVRQYRDGIAVRLCTTRLGCNPALAGIKHLNRLEQVLARAEWDDPDIAEGLMRDAGGRIVEGTMSNLFAALDGALVTPRLDECGVAGVMRDVIIEWARDNGLAVAERDLVDADLRRADEIFLCNSLIGVWPVRRIDDLVLHPGPIAARVAAAIGASSLMPEAALRDAEAGRHAGEG
ncbi:MAG: aminodeoxychorismate lyase [Gammaproteobacteria bacterium]